MKHPAKFSDALMPVFAEAIKRNAHPDMLYTILDPFAGTGKIFELERLLPGATCYGVELEPEWAAMSRAEVGDALHLRFYDNTMSVICTSPSYGNRMADHHEARDASQRNTYRHTLGRPLTPGSSAGLQWGDAYRGFHILAWNEACRVLKPGGLFILNISNHIRKGYEMEVSEWHKYALEELGLRCLRDIHVETPRQRFGANRARVEFEHVYVFRK